MDMDTYGYRVMNCLFNSSIEAFINESLKKLMNGLINDLIMS